MSLINDALKRTQQTTGANQPPRLNELELYPIEPVHRPPERRGGGAKVIIWIIVLLGVFGNVALWIVFKNVTANREVSARTPDNALEATVTETEQGPTEPEIPIPDVRPQPSTPTVTPPEQALPNTDAALLEAPKPPRPEFRLKTIVTHPIRPSAMINNRVAFVGDKVEGYTVAAIGKDDVTLVLDDDQVVITLP